MWTQCQALDSWKALLAWDAVFKQDLSEFLMKDCACVTLSTDSRGRVAAEHVLWPLAPLEE